MKQVFTFMIIILSSHLFSQNVVINGQVIDYESKKPMTYMSIGFDSKNNTVTKKNGKFSFQVDSVSSCDTLKLHSLYFFSIYFINLPTDTDTITLNNIPAFEYFCFNSMADYFCGPFDFKCKRESRKHAREERLRINNYYSEKDSIIGNYIFIYDNKKYQINVETHCIDLKE